MTLSPKQTLLAGVKILESVLSPCGFVFELRDEGIGAMGPFAWGEFVRDDRRLELHYRYGLGLVRYHVAGRQATHEAYIRELGLWGKNHYPGFTSKELTGFHDLAEDLKQAVDFLSGDGGILRQAAEREGIDDAQKSRELMAGYVGDTWTLNEMRSLFQEKRYADVVALADKIKYPELMNESQRRIIELARKRIGN